MKLIIDITEDAFLACKYWLNEGVAQWAETIIANGTPYEERPKGELNLKYLAKFTDKTPCYEMVKQLGFAGSYEDYLKTICGADMRVKEGGR